MPAARFPRASRESVNQAVLTDVWSQWLLHTRHADDSEYQRAVHSLVRELADRVLDGARLSPGLSMVDVGSGDGLLAFRAIERVGATLSVRLADISLPLLRHAEARATELGVSNQCSFIECSADNLEPIADASTDVVTTRAVLAYVADKAAAFREFHRILRPGGRISIAEPILQDEAFYACALRRRVDDAAMRPSPDPFLALLHRWKAAQYPDTEEGRAKSPIANYGERDLLNLARASGFVESHLELHIDDRPSLISSWEIFLGVSPHPLAPPLKVILAEQFTAEERQLFERLVRPTVESGKNITTERIAYLTAAKPADSRMARPFEARRA